MGILVFQFGGVKWYKELRKGGGFFFFMVDAGTKDAARMVSVFLKNW